MEIHARRQHADQENMYATKGKSNAALPVKRQGLAVRGALGDMNTNVQTSRGGNIGKVAVAAAEFEKKASLNRAPLRSNYGHVQSKIDTGLASKPTSKPTLKREESTAGLAVKAVAQLGRAPLKDTTSNSLKNGEFKQSGRSLLQLKKSSLEKENKKTALLPVKERTKEKEARILKPIIKDPSESLGKLKLVEIRSHSSNSDSSVSLPNDIEDIDAEDDSPLAVSIYIRDIYKYLTELELLYPIKPDHMAKQTMITGKMRATLIDWLVEVHRQFRLVLETFQLTVGILDRYLQVVPNVQRNRLQLVGVTAMYIASKYEEIYSPSVEDFVVVTDEAFSKAEIFQCERDMLSKLSFCLARPVPHSFLRRFVKAAHGTAKQHHLAKYFIELSLVEYHMAHYRPSELAASAICLSQYVLSPSSTKLERIWTPTLRYYTEYSLEHITPIVKKIAKIVVNADKAKTKAVYTKYSDKLVSKVSTLPQLREERIHELAEVVRETYSPI